MGDCQLCCPEDQKVCLCVLARFAHFRDYVASGNEDKIRHVRQRSRMPYEVTEDDRKPRTTMVARATKSVPLAVSLKRRLAVLSCPYRGERVGCGCGDLRHCSAKYGSWLSTYNECVECVASNNDSHP